MRISGIFLAIVIVMLAVQTNTWAAGVDTFRKGMAAYNTGSYKEAVELFSEARLENLASAPIAYYLGMACKHIGDYREAARNFRDAIILNPPIREAYNELIESLYQSEQYNAAAYWKAHAEKEGIPLAQGANLATTSSNR